MQVLCCIDEISPVAISATRKAIAVPIEARQQELAPPGTTAPFASLVSLWCFAPIHEGELGNRDHDPNKTQRCERSAPKVSHGRPLQNPSWCRVV
jgi:hypothetical protein